ncbi:MAG: hypothetical protein ACI38Q_03965 [Candidatus Bruticola sp.]
MSAFVKRSKNWQLSAVVFLFIGVALWALCVLSACQSVPSGNSLSAKETVLAFAEAALVKGDRNSACSFLSEEARLSCDSLLDIVGGTVESARHIEVVTEEDCEGGSRIKLKAKTAKSNYISEAVIVLFVRDGRVGKKIDNFYVSLTTKGKEKISL